nr:putative integron gene cassette protein [uncultured bacterium]
MTNAFEKKLLLTVLTQLDSPTPLRPGHWWRLLPSLALWIAVFLIAILYFRYGRPAHWTDALLVVAALGIGYYWSFHLYRTSYRRQWPMLAPHFDRASIQNRLDELGV